MQHDTFSPSGPRFEDSFEEWLPGLELTHILHISSTLDLDAVTSVLSCIKDVQDAVDGWTIARIGAVLDQRITMRRISEGRVRSLRERLAQLDRGLKIRLEHQCNGRVG
jgi:hypothetical protein